MNMMMQSTGAGVNQSSTDSYRSVARAIDFLVEHFEQQPTLEETASQVGLSPQHFQRVFKSGAGVSPKKFLQYIAAGEAKRTMAAGGTVLDASFAAGLSGSSRLHDLFIVSEAMTPGAYRKKGAGLLITFGVVNGPFGRALIGATEKGVAWLSFPGDVGEAAQIAEMKADWPAADFKRSEPDIMPIAGRAFDFATNKPLGERLGLYIQGTNFQLKVWEALLKIPFGGLATYGDIARQIGSPNASRAVGSAVGANMVSLLIPCHRVIRSSGVVHNYRWGAPRKCALLAMEHAIENA